MCPLCRLVVVVFWMMVRAASMLAQGPPDPSGHWEGTVQLPIQPLLIEVDVARNAKGELTAVFAEPSAGIKGFPFSKVEFEGRTLRLVLKASAQASTFTGVLSEDGKTIAGDAEQGGEKTTFTLTRAGDARVVTQPKNARISKNLEGVWKGAIDLADRQMRVILTLTNQADGTATGTVMSPDGSGVEIPVGIKESGNQVVIDVPSVGSAFAGVLNAAKSELAGTWTQATAALPLILRREAPRQD